MRVIKGIKIFDTDKSEYITSSIQGGVTKELLFRGERGTYWTLDLSFVNLTHGITELSIRQAIRWLVDAGLQDTAESMFASHLEEA